MEPSNEQKGIPDRKDSGPVDSIQEYRVESKGKIHVFTSIKQIQKPLHDGFFEDNARLVAVSKRADNTEEILFESFINRRK